MKRHAPATARNSAPIAQALGRELPASGLVLEVASGTGEHALFLSRQFPGLVWQPSDRDEATLESIRAWRAEADLPNLRDPVVLDASRWPWGIGGADAILCINMVHIAPCAAAVGLFEGAGRILRPGSPLVLYGPYREPDVPTAPSNIRFEQWLKDQDDRFGLRDLREVDALALNNGLQRTARHEMPANNLMLVYRKA